MRAGPNVSDCGLIRWSSLPGRSRIFRIELYAGACDECLDASRGRVELIASRSESDDEAHCDTALASCCVNRQPGASAYCSSDRRKTECVGQTAAAALLLVRVAQSRGEGAECRGADYGADDRAVSERIA